MAVSKRLRYEILRRDNHACRYCGGTAPDVKLTVDHVVPTTLGGSDQPSNLVAACADCNSGKSATPPDAAIVADVDAKALLWARAQDIVADRLRVTVHEKHLMEEHFYDEWETLRTDRRRSSELPDDFGDSIELFMRRGMPYEAITELARVALRNRAVGDKWKYFCGCVWTQMRQMDEDTVAVIKTWEVT
ncbi:putative HNH endonuclease [uncultured Caudovirales phage]|uniref:Putative HNH endonuclease n=1 Tax=uncultured Caudovirales phage TaxID=2100421 RepID=A0A2H4JGM1_9CAUD|nr:putative HNH endonuclease [uncultured Caudovirales phage]